MTDWDGINFELSLSMYDNGRVVEDLGLGVEVKMRRLAGCVLCLNPPSPTPSLFSAFLFEWSRNDGEHSLLRMEKGKGMRKGRGWRAQCVTII